MRTIFLCIALGLVLVSPAWPLDLADDFSHLQAREYFLRVGLARDSAVLRVVPQHDFLIHDKDGKVLYNGKGDMPLRFIAGEPHPLSIVWYLRLGYFAPNERQKAEDMAREAGEKTRLPVRAMVDPSRERSPLPSGEMPPPLPWVVAAGPFPDEIVADEARETAEKFGKAKLFKTLSGPATTLVEARNEKGELLAHAVGYLGVRVKDSAALIRADALKPGNQAWANRENWLNTKSYHGTMEIRTNEKGRLILINRVFFEDYLYGVVPPEIGPEAPFEMLKAQAVISRSVAIAMVRDNAASNWYFDLCDSQSSQVYSGALGETARTNAAVDATCGQVCVYDNHVIDALFSHCCGGATSSIEDVWPEAPPRRYLSRRLDALTNQMAPGFSKYDDVEHWVSTKPAVLCNLPNQEKEGDFKDAFRWTRSFTAEQLTRLVREIYPEAKKVVNIRVDKRTPSGQVSCVVLSLLPEKTITLTHESDIRNVFGGLPSSFFVLERDYEKKGKALAQVMFRGAGMGHGVGLCQAGATGLAKLGKDYLFILRHYYQGVSIFKIYK